MTFDQAVADRREVLGSGSVCRDDGELADHNAATFSISANIQTLPNVYDLQIGAVATGYGPLLSATVSGTAKVGSKLTCTKTEANTWPAVKTS